MQVELVRRIFVNKKIVGIFVSKNLVFMIAVVLLCAISLEVRAFSIKGLYAGMSMSKAIAGLDKRGYKCEDHANHGSPHKTCIRKDASTLADYLDNYGLITENGKKLVAFTVTCAALNCGNMNTKQVTQSLVKAKIMRKPVYQTVVGNIKGYCEMDSKGGQICVMKGGDGVTVIVEQGTGGPSFD